MISKAPAAFELPRVPQKKEVGTPGEIERSRPFGGKHTERDSG